jgi:hypothetical protein
MSIKSFCSTSLKGGALTLAFVIGWVTCTWIMLPTGLAIAESRTPTLADVPATESYCLAAQRVITSTTVPMDLVVHDDFDSFVNSKALIEGPTIQQYIWRNNDGSPVGVSCKMKSADHLQFVYGYESAGPDGLCQDINWQVYQSIAAEVKQPAYPEVLFDVGEEVSNNKRPAMTGPDWLAPYSMTYVDAAGALHVAARGFVVDFNDPRYRKAPEKFRGVHYCHLIAPEYLRALISGEREPGAMVGKRVVVAESASTNQNSR